MPPAVTVDVVIFAMRENDLAVLLVRRLKPPYEGCWALPGGFVHGNESLERAAARLLYAETGLEGVALEQVAAFGDPGRDPRGHTVSVVFYTFAVASARPSGGREDAGAGDAEWHLLRTLSLEGAGAGSYGESPPPPSVSRVRRPSAAPVVRLAFDHARIIGTARRRLQERLVDPTRPSPFELLPQHFTLTELQRVYEAVIGAPLDKRTFRARLVDSGMVEPLSAARPRTAQLYRWRTAKRVR